MASSIALFHDYFRQELSGVCYTKAQHMISLTTRPLEWGGKVWAHTYNDVMEMVFSRLSHVHCH